MKILKECICKVFAVHFITICSSSLYTNLPLCLLGLVSIFRAVSHLLQKSVKCWALFRLGLLKWRKSALSWMFFHILKQSSFVNFAHVIVGHTNRTKYSGMNAGLLCSWSSVVTHDVTSRHACHRMTLNLPSHNSVTEVAILTPISNIPATHNLKWLSSQTACAHFFLIQDFCYYYINLLKTKRNLIYIRNQSVPRSKHFPPRL